MSTRPLVTDLNRLEAPAIGGHNALLNDVAAAVAVIVAGVVAIVGVIRVSVVIASIITIGSIEAVTDAGADKCCGGNRKSAMPEAAAITGKAAAAESGHRR